MEFPALVLMIIVLFQLYRAYISKKTNSIKCLLNKTAIITGGSSGLGYSTALHLASRGCKVIIANRTNGAKSRDSIITSTGNPNISYKFLDLASLDSVRTFCKEIKCSEEKIDILINNAGMPISTRLKTEDDLNYIMQVNIFGAFLLTHLLIEPLKSAKSARIIFLTSTFSFFHNLTVDNLNLTDYELSKATSFKLYANSKLCNIIVAQELAKKLDKYGIMVNSVDPGAVRTDIFRKSFVKLGNIRWIEHFTTFAMVFISQDPLDAAHTLLHLATIDKTNLRNGSNYAYCRTMMKPWVTRNQRFCEEIYEKMEELLQLTPEEKLWYDYELL